MGLHDGHSAVQPEAGLRQVLEHVQVVQAVRLVLPIQACARPAPVEAISYEGRRAEAVWRMRPPMPDGWAAQPSTGQGCTLPAQPAASLQQPQQLQIPSAMPAKDAFDTLRGTLIVVELSSTYCAALLTQTPLLHEVGVMIAARKKRSRKRVSVGAGRGGGAHRW